MLKALQLALVIACTLHTTVRADELSAPRSPPDEPSVAITVSPVHLAIPMAELTTEVRASRRVGIAAIAGIGTFHEMSTNQRVALYEGGASVRYYALGSFRKGLQLGLEALYVHAVTESTTVDVRAAGLGISPFAGYKWTHSSGFTFEGQAGPSFMVARAKAATGQMAERSKVGPMLNLNLGYSF
jgi:hypothetical protein